MLAKENPEVWSELTKNDLKAILTANNIPFQEKANRTELQTQVGELPLSAVIPPDNTVAAPAEGSGPDDAAFAIKEGQTLDVVTTDETGTAIEGVIDADQIIDSQDERITALETENATLKQENAARQAENITLREENARLKTENTASPSTPEGAEKQEKTAVILVTAPGVPIRFRAGIKVTQKETHHEVTEEVLTSLLNDPFVVVRPVKAQDA